MDRPVVRAVFALLVLATIAAFFATQQLKSEFPLVIRFAAKPKQISPNGDHYRDTTQVGFDLSRPAKVSFSILDSEGNEVRRLVQDRQLAGSSHNRFTWNGRNDDGDVVPDGIYRMRVVRRDEGRIIDSVKEIRVDLQPPHVRILSAKPSIIAPRAPGQSPEVTIRYSGPVEQGTGVPRLPHRRRRQAACRASLPRQGPQRCVARRGGHRPRADRAGARRRLRVHREGARQGRQPRRGARADPASRAGGSRNRGVGAHLHSDGAAERGGGRLGGDVRGRADRPHCRVRPVAPRRPRADPPRQSGRRAPARGDPSKAKTGVYVMRVRAGRQRAVWPVAVAGLPQSKRAAERARPLVVLPAITWQGLNDVDDDFDGFADSLPKSRSVGLDRPFAGGGLPSGFNSEVAPLLRYLDRERLPYDLTTDLSLARGEGPALGNAPGVAFAGSALWEPEPLLRRLRDEVADGLRVASFGADALQAHRSPARRPPGRPAPAAGQRVRGDHGAAAQPATRR